MNRFKRVTAAVSGICLICASYYALQNYNKKQTHGAVFPNYTDYMYRKAVTDQSRTPYFILVTIRNARTGQANPVCISAPFLEGALHTEMGLDYDPVNQQKVHRLVLESADRVFTLSKPQALQNVTPHYTPSELRIVQGLLASHTQRELLSDAFLESVYKTYRDKPGQQKLVMDFTAYRDAAAYSLLERGILCRRGHMTGGLIPDPDTGSVLANLFRKF